MWEWKSPNPLSLITGGCNMRIRQYDTYPIEYRCVDEENRPVDLSSAGTVGFYMIKDGDLTPTVAASASMKSAAVGLVEYQFVEGDTDVAGMYRAEWKIDFSGSVVTYPRNDILWIYIVGATHALE